MVVHDILQSHLIKNKTDCDHLHHSAQPRYTEYQLSLLPGNWSQQAMWPWFF